MARMTRWWPSGERIYRPDGEGDEGLMVLGSNWNIEEGEPRRVLTLMPLPVRVSNTSRLLEGTVVLLQDEVCHLERQLEEARQETNARVEELRMQRQALDQAYDERRIAEAKTGNTYRELVAAKELLARHEKQIRLLKRQKRSLERALDAVERKRK